MYVSACTVLSLAGYAALERQITAPRIEPATISPTEPKMATPTNVRAGPKLRRPASAMNATTNNTTATIAFTPGVSAAIVVNAPDNGPVTPANVVRSIASLANPAISNPTPTNAYATHVGTRFPFNRPASAFTIYS